MATADLRGRVAVVTGATRGAGLGIASVLGEAGATVYVTGRSSRSGDRTEDLPGTVEDAAEAVTRRGGSGHALRCDHSVDDEVAAAFARIGEEQDGIDILVNNVWGGYEGQAEGVDTLPFWLEDVATHWRGMFEIGLRAHLIASCHAVPLMLGRDGGLIVNTIAWAEGGYGGNLLYDVAKQVIVAAGERMALELRSWGVTVVSLAPGFMRSERVMAAHAARPFDLSETESTEYIGRAVRALALDPDVARFSGARLNVGDLARLYDFTDVDGTRRPAFGLPPGWEAQALEKQRERAEAARA